MTDCFALFNEPRRPWLDPEQLKDKLHRYSVEHHPDVAQSDAVDFAALNSAYRTLHDPKARLKHLLELEFPGALSGHLQIPGDITRLFETMTRERHSVAAFLEKKSRLTTPLEIALLSSEQLELTGVLEKLLSVLNQKHEGLLMQLKFIDAVWEEDRASSKDTLVEIYQEISYVGRWIEQTREDVHKMTNDE